MAEPLALAPPGTSALVFSSGAGATGSVTSSSITWSRRSITAGLGSGSTGPEPFAPLAPLEPADPLEPDPLAPCAAGEPFTGTGRGLAFTGFVRAGLVIAGLAVAFALPAFVVAFAVTPPSAFALTLELTFDVTLA